MDEILNTVVSILQVVIVAAIIFRLFRILRPFEKGLIERFGKYNREAKPGLNIVIPWVERLIIVDMREQVIDVPPQEVITKDNVNITVDAVIYYEPTDPKKLVYNVGDFITAATKLAQTNLRNVVGDLELDAALTSRENINTQLKLILDDATDKWGTKVVRVEIQRVDPPQDVQDAMNKVMKAERDRRAAVTEAEGEKRAAILTAEGERQSQILSAQGEAEKILNQTPEIKQTVLFSATLPKWVEKTAKKYLTNPETVNVNTNNQGPSTIKHTIYNIDKPNKMDALRAILDKKDGPILVFGRTIKAKLTKLQQ